MKKTEPQVIAKVEGDREEAAELHDLGFSVRRRLERLEFSEICKDVRSIRNTEGRELTVTARPKPYIRTARLERIRTDLVVYAEGYMARVRGE